MFVNFGSLRSQSYFYLPESPAVILSLHISLKVPAEPLEVLICNDEGKFVVKCCWHYFTFFFDDQVV